MKKVYISFAIAAIWLIAVIYELVKASFFILLPIGKVGPTITLFFLMTLYFGLLFGWIAPLTFGLWSLRKGR